MLLAFVVRGMTDFLLELRSEEIPARMQVKAKEDLARLFAEEIAKAGLQADAIEVFATPRRLALIARGLPLETAATSEERKGPRTSAPEAALAGFLRSTGLTREQLTERDGVFFAAIDRPGRATPYVLAEVIPAIVRAFPWPKSMRWGAASASTESLRWVRPLQGIVALFGETIVPFEIDGIESGATTVGHRFHHPGPITIGSAADYIEKLRACHVIVHFSERCALIRDGARAAAAAEGLTLIEDDGLVAENAGLTEWPVPLLGRFDAAFLDVPREVIQLTMRTNQKYFACADSAGAMANAFVCTANIDATDPAAIVAGNRKVLAARLADAKFFWEADLKVPLDEQAAKLKDIVFHEKLGTVADKVERVKQLARWLCEEGIVKGDADLAERAAYLCKADLVTGMVGEFPELQGIIGGHLARAQGEPDAVADAIRDHYKPVGQGDEVPTAPVTVAVSLADKLDTLTGFFFVDEAPTGSRDPFALRRAAIAVITTILRKNLRVGLLPAVMEAGAPHIAKRIIKIDRLLRDTVLEKQKTDDPNFNRIRDLNAWRDEIADTDGFALLALGAYQSFVSPLLSFLADRLKVQQREAGVRYDLIDAVFALGGEDDLVRLLARVRALQAFVATEDGAKLLGGYKRAANILKKEGHPLDVSPAQAGAHTPSDERSDHVEAGLGPGLRRGDGGLSYMPEPCEAALITALDSAEPLAASAIGHEDFEGAMTALASLRAPIDAFFETVTVNDPDPAKRAARLALLARVRDAVHSVADFSKIEG